MKFEVLNSLPSFPATRFVLRPLVEGSSPAQPCLAFAANGPHEACRTRLGVIRPGTDRVLIRFDKAQHREMRLWRVRWITISIDSEGHLF